MPVKRYFPAEDEARRAAERASCRGDKCEMPQGLAGETGIEPIKWVLGIVSAAIRDNLYRASRLEAAT